MLSSSDNPDPMDLDGQDEVEDIQRQHQDGRWPFTEPPEDFGAPILSRLFAALGLKEPADLSLFLQAPQIYSPYNFDHFHFSFPFWS